MMLLLGKHIVVEESPNPSEKGLHGIVVDETKYAFHIKTPKGLKTVLKSHRMFFIERQHMMGNQLIGKYEERMKR